ncbi:urease accessory protein [Proteus mirabilis]|uniref:Urease accessory protein n=1 Tax=Proteus mirabilis TaxID=584 RepID=A0A379FJR5_PROMI|nr:urease accessory protein [Proteus mirabilis]
MKKFTQIIDQQKALELTSTEKPKLTLCLTNGMSAPKVA